MAPHINTTPPNSTFAGINHIFRINRETFKNFPTHILQGHPALTQIAPDIYMIFLTRAEVAHAYSLLCGNPNNHEDGISFYFLSALESFPHASRNGNQFSLVRASEDRKRRFSEDIGVIVGCFIMHYLFKIDWATISQISMLKKKGKRPDFQGYSGSDFYVFETKGTSVLSSVEKAAAAGCDQLLHAPPGAVEKAVISTYIPGSTPHGPAFSIVADPPTELPRKLSSYESRVLHLLKIFQFMGELEAASTTIKEINNYLKKETFDDSFHAYRGSWALSMDNIAQTAVKKLKERLRAGKKRGDYIGKSGEIRKGETIIKYFRGVNFDLIERNLESDEPLPEVKFTTDQKNSLESIFTDGTMFAIEAP